jgi:hypothetical protein
VSELLDRIDSHELTEWIAFDAIDPIGAWRMDYQFGLLCALQANMHRGKGKPALTPQDFMAFQPEDPAAKERKMQAEFESFVKSWNNSVTPTKTDASPRLS